MIKKLMMVLAILAGSALTAHAAPAATYTPRIDGAWFDTACFGCPGDTVLNEVLNQQADFDAAAKADEEDRTVESLQECVKLSLFSYDQAGYYLELGRLTGDVAYYQKAAVAARAAIAIPANPKWKTRKGENVPEKSHLIGKKWLSVALKHGAS